MKIQNYTKNSKKMQKFYVATTVAGIILSFMLIGLTVLAQEVDDKGTTDKYEVVTEQVESIEDTTDSKEAHEYENLKAMSSDTRDFLKEFSQEIRVNEAS